jgi:acetolactate synthase-1/2/3 large subunit
VLVERTEDFPKAFKEAQASGKPAVIQLRIDPDASTPAMTLTKIGAAARAKQKG